MKKIFWIVVITLLVMNVAGQDFSITGTIVDNESGEALVGASVKDITSGKEVLTDFDGKFTITGVKAGTNAIKVSYISYQEKKLNRVIVKEGASAELNIKLKRVTHNSASDNFLALEDNKNKQS